MSDPTGIGTGHSYSPMERSSTSEVYRPQIWFKNMPDYRSGLQPFGPSDIKIDELRRPAVMRSQAYQQQVENERQYVSLPGQGEERGGTARGGVFYCLPGQRVNVYDPPVPSPKQAGVAPRLCEAHVTYGEGVWRAYGKPGLASGDCEDGSFRQGIVGGVFKLQFKAPPGWS